ncbi:MAG: hypothetical protein ABR598_06010 [Candidatus Dormibacteria bacterium]
MADDQARGRQPKRIELSVGETWQLDAYGPRQHYCYGYIVDPLPKAQAALVENGRVELGREPEGFFDRVQVRYRATAPGEATVAIGQTCEAKRENSSIGCDILAFLPIRITVAVH